MNLADMQHGNPPTAIHMMDDLIVPDERVRSALHNSRLVENLRDFTVDQNHQGIAQ